MGGAIEQHWPMGQLYLIAIPHFWLDRAGGEGEPEGLET